MAVEEGAPLCGIIHKKKSQQGALGQESPPEGSRKLNTQSVSSGLQEVEQASYQYTRVSHLLVPLKCLPNSCLPIVWNATAIFNQHY